MSSPLTRPLHLAAVCLALLATAPARAESVEAFDEPSTFAGSYLSALSASAARDLDAAVAFSLDALSQDPDNTALIERTFNLLLANGDMEEAFPLAKVLLEKDKENRVASIALGAQALKAKDYKAASKYFGVGEDGPLANLSGGLLAAWSAAGAGQADAALDIVNGLTGPSWYEVFKSFHGALIADVVGRKELARELIGKAWKTDGSALRVTEAYARIEARAGNVDSAKMALLAFAKGGSLANPVIRKLLAEIESGKKPDPMVRTVQQGAAEALYGLGSALAGENGGEDAATIYLRLALYLDPHQELTVMALGDLFQNAQRWQASIAMFERIPKTSVLRKSADVQVALSLDAMDKPDQAIRRLGRIAGKGPQDAEMLTTLGNIQRARKRYTEAAASYTRAIAALGDDANRNWLIHYFRGIAYERAKQWPQAEADFLKALEIAPQQPQVLNYLGYSWIDKGIQLDRGMEMIKQAVELKPNDGYIVDSLGWAYYRLNRFNEAVAQLERAVGLKSDDPTINDHLGDAYWKVGRKREAVFQWSHARDLGPEPEDKPRILAKIANGLDKVEETKVAAADAGVASDASSVPATVTVMAGDTLWKIAQRVYGNGDLYNRLLDANRAKLPNPDQLVPGTVLDVPRLDSAGR